MKGIFMSKNFSKYLPSKNTSNIQKTLNGTNHFFFHSEDKSKPKINEFTKKNSLFSEQKSKNYLGFGNITRKIQFSLSSLICNYYYRLQFLNLNNSMKDLAILKLSDEKNNLNRNNKNLNEEEVDFKKLNDASKGNKNSDGNFF
jgi:hypothetical protein